MVAVLGLGVGGTAAAADNGQWSVLPAATAVGQRPYFYLAAAPGGTVRDTVTVTNRTDRPRTFRLYAADAYNTARDGGFALRGPDEPRLGAAAWVRLDRERITVPPRGAVDVGFGLAVPDRAEPGDHPGAVVALEDTPAAAADGAPGIGIRQAVGARLYLRVGGPTAAALAVEDVRVAADARGAEVSYTLRNLGNVTLRPRAALTATGALGRTLLRRGPPARPPSCCPAGRSASPPAGRTRRTWSGPASRCAPKPPGSPPKAPPTTPRTPCSYPLWRSPGPSRRRPGRRWEPHRGEWPV